MNRVKSVVICGAIALVSSLALARVHPFGDAGLYAAKATETPIMEHSPVPPEVRAILVDKCADCHSRQTRAPFYGHVAPVSWLMERDILQAQKAMNLSQWETYSEEQQQALAFKIAHEAKAHKMPPLQYRMIHWNARVEDAEIRALANWAHVSSSESNQQAGDGDPVRGKGLVEKRCSGCHSLTQNHQGPRLQGVYGRVSGSVADYTYSQTMKNSRIAWNEKSLDKWLADPDAFLPGNNMDFLVPKPQDRLDIISYLKQSSGKLAYIATRSRHWPWMASELPATSTLSCQLLLTALCAQGASLGGGWPSPSAPTILRKARIYHGAIGVSRYLSLENFGFPVIPLNLEVWYTLHQQLRLLRDSSNVLRPDRPCSVCGHRCNR